MSFAIKQRYKSIMKLMKDDETLFSKSTHLIGKNSVEFFQKMEKKKRAMQWRQVCKPVQKEGLFPFFGLWFFHLFMHQKNKYTSTLWIIATSLLACFISVFIKHHINKYRPHSPPCQSVTNSLSIEQSRHHEAFFTTAVFCGFCSIFWYHCIGTKVANLQGRSLSNFR